MTTNNIINILVGQDNYPERVCRMVKEMVSGYYGLPLESYDTKSRKREIIKLKQSTVYFVRKLLPQATLIFIGKSVGYDHATVIHHLRVVDTELELGGDTKKEIEDIGKMVHLKDEAITFGGAEVKDYYFANFGECDTIQLPNGKCIALGGMLPEEVGEITKLLSGYYKTELTPRNHANTGLFVFERIEKERG
jgi:hypothetical protein